MRYAPTLLGLLMLSLILGCFNGGQDDTTAAQATIDAAVARLSATLAANATPTPTSGSPSPVPTPTPILPSQTRALLPPTLPPTAPGTASPASGITVYPFADVRNWEYAEQSAPAVIARLRAIPWIDDGLHGVDEFNAAERLVNIGIDAPDTLNLLLDSHGLAQGIAPLDLPALLSLQRMARNRPERLAQLTRAGWFQDGWTDAEAAIVAVLFERSRFLSPEFDAIVSDPGVLTVDMSATTNRAGETVPVVILRSGPRPSGSPVMLTAQFAVPLFEEMFDAPFPTPAVVIHITPYVAGAAGGTNYQTHVTLKPEIDANEKPEFSVHSVFHEIAHYYLYARPTWYAEGGAEFAASYARNVLTGTPIEPTNSPCSEARSLSELETLFPDGSDAGANVDPSLWQCNYSLGERLMLTLYQALGEERFLQGWRELYGTLAQTPNYPSQHEFDEVELRVAWLHAFGRVNQPELEQIWDRWYRGTASFVVDGVPDLSSPDPNLPAINGRIEQAYVALSPDGPAVNAFSAADATGWAYLTLEYSQRVEGTARELTLEIVEHYEDGFPYSRRDVAITFQPQHAGSTQWISLGPQPGQRWALGRYWAYVYESGRKVAEIEYGVTP